MPICLSCRKCDLNVPPAKIQLKKLQIRGTKKMDVCSEQLAYTRQALHPVHYQCMEGSRHHYIFAYLPRISEGTKLRENNLFLTSRALFNYQNNSTKIMYIHLWLHHVFLFGISPLQSYMCVTYLKMPKSFLCFQYKSDVHQMYQNMARLSIWCNSVHCT